MIDAEKKYAFFQYGTTMCPTAFTASGSGFTRWVFFRREYITLTVDHNNSQYPS